MYLACSAGGDRAALMLGMLEKLVATDPDSCKWKEVAGISAGALVSTLVARSNVDYPQNMIKDINYMKNIMMNKKFHPLKPWTSLGKKTNALDALLWHNSVYRSMDPIIDKVFDENLLRKSGRILRVGTYDRDTGEYVTFSSDKSFDIMKKAVTASASVPVAFPSVKIHGDSYEDGGMRHIIPINEIQEWLERDGKKHITLMLAYPMDRKRFMDVNVGKGGNMLLNEMNSAVSDVMYTHLENDLTDLSGMLGIPYKDLVESPYKVFKLGDTTFRFISPASDHYSTFLSMTPKSNDELFTIGKHSIGS